ncbi:hypothetical protein [Anaerostipes faecalis]|uniref:hypothetical protein n=1 Tax=Anaerostipes faecalis TaxID=2738446 RepID=UPI003F016A96
MNNNDKHISSRLLASAGALMMISGILMAICGKIAYGGVFWVSASCMFIASYNIRKRAISALSITAVLLFMLPVILYLKK